MNNEEGFGEEFFSLLHVRQKESTAKKLQKILKKTLKCGFKYVQNQIVTKFKYNWFGNTLARCWESNELALYTYDTSKLTKMCVQCVCVCYLCVREREREREREIFWDS